MVMNKALKFKNNGGAKQEENEIDTEKTQYGARADRSRLFREPVKIVNKFARKGTKTIYMTMNTDRPFISITDEPNYDKSQDFLVFSFTIPYDAVYLFVDEGKLKSSNVPMTFAVRSKQEDVIKEMQYMKEMYVFDNQNVEITTIAKLEELEHQYTPRIYIIDGWGNAVQIGKVKVSEKQMQKWQAAYQKRLEKTLTIGNTKMNEEEIFQDEIKIINVSDVYEDNDEIIRNEQEHNDEKNGKLADENAMVFSDIVYEYGCVNLIVKKNNEQE